ncbi:alpha-hydroxy-acid oxidizing protein [Oceanivirga miroungae]|uniref:Isopentenyl pyrophosphate isomerase n=1 Tax=Oceanivirga miroungae TaxID=1130046 RepID=A0A6I8MBX2_9FUSO|nr:alpha-hydroxy-acid oxidizing protein [Oceanivirga miroungae]VWL85703.1 isopentenyl pyrophosphate isomerase [Oceanivirga miroungae]
MRKIEHIKYALLCEKKEVLENVFLEYNSLIDFGIEDVDLSTSFCDINFKYPIYINAMTGGSDESDNINKRLYNIAKKIDIFMFSGSYSPNLSENSYYYPKKMGANLGLDKSLEDFKKCILELEPRIIQAHINPIQELIMHEGDRSFNYKEKIKDLVANIDIPLIIKETGYGMSKSTIDELVKLGVKTIDLSSNDGTNFSRIEDMRNNKNREHLYNLGYKLEDSMINASEYIDKIEVLASGGISNSLEIVKALAMGAKSVGISAYILKKIYNNESDDDIINDLNEMIYEIKLLILSTNSKNLTELKGKWYFRNRSVK